MPCYACNTAVSPPGQSTTYIFQYSWYYQQANQISGLAGQYKVNTMPKAIMTGVLGQTPIRTKMPTQPTKSNGLKHKKAYINILEASPLKKQVHKHISSSYPFESQMVTTELEDFTINDLDSPENQTKLIQNMFLANDNEPSIHIEHEGIYYATLLCNDPYPQPVKKLKWVRAAWDKACHHHQVDISYDTMVPKLSQFKSRAHPVIVVVYGFDTSADDNAIDHNRYVLLGPLLSESLLTNVRRAVAKYSMITLIKCAINEWESGVYEYSAVFRSHLASLNEFNTMMAPIGLVKKLLQQVYNNGCHAFLNAINKYKYAEGAMDQHVSINTELEDNAEESNGGTEVPDDLEDEEVDNGAFNIDIIENCATIVWHRNYVHHIVLCKGEDVDGCNQCDINNIGSYDLFKVHESILLEKSETFQDMFRAHDKLGTVPTDGHIEALPIILLATISEGAFELFCFQCLIKAHLDDLMDKEYSMMDPQIWAAVLRAQCTI
ncbi:hypothetical protein HD554DRAFT_2036816 [Boletus coccyginus]|nr:hypothetical protein HD554DRAFT_2036816 [Boletus coccyginus]